jgi:hypothetical protein
MPLRFSRRALLAAPAVLARAAPAPIRKEIFRRAPSEGVAVLAYAFYTRARGGDMLSIEARMTRSDTVDTALVRRSADYGKTWSAATELRTGERRPGGMWRRHPRGGLADRRTGRYVEFWNEGLLPSDDPLEGMRNWSILYHVSRDGGRTFDAPRPIIHSGAGFDTTHPLPDVWLGKNCAMLGDVASVPLAAPDGRILLPVALTRLGPDGKLYNPVGAYTYTDAALLLGRWRGEALEWEMSEPIRSDPERATRGMDEPTVEFLEDGRLLMIMRGSNNQRPAVPGYRWLSLSSDGGRTWTAPAPWTYGSGAPFFSPSSCSQLLRHSSGRLFWLGNINETNPHGNRPRYPFVIGEVNRKSGALEHATVRVVDTLAPGEDPILTLSNFYAREERRTREIAVHMTRMFARPEGWSGDAYLYHIPV